MKTYMSVIAFIIISFFLSSTCAFGQKEQGTSSTTLEVQPGSQEKGGRGSFLESTIRFDNSSLKKIVLHPESIVAAPEAFWESDSAYHLYKLWHQFASLPIDIDHWKKDLQPFINTPDSERNKNSQLVISQKMMNKEKIDDFNKRAIPYLYSFLPKDCPPINATIFFTTATMTNGFQMNNDVVVYGENSDKENLFIHELFHRCQRACGTIADKNDSPVLDQTNPLSFILSLFWAEGTATYVGFNALKEFPNVDPLLRRDYMFLQDTTKINQLHQSLNELFKYISVSAKNTKDQNEIQKRVMQIGFVDRAFYIVGCNMAATIDKKLGRDAFREILLHGPKYFIQKYNSLVDREHMIFDLYNKN
jgi:hypothetical protein